MGYITDLVIADFSDLQAVANAEAPASRWPGISDIGFSDESPLVRLYLLLMGVRGDTSLEDVEEVVLKDYVEGSPSDGSWAFAFPQDMTSLLSKLSDADAPKLADEWQASEEVGDVEWDRATTGSVLLRLRTIAKEAVKTDSRIIWRTGE